MKKRLLMVLLVGLMLLSLAVPATAVDVGPVLPTVAAGYYELVLPNGETETIPRSEETRIYWRTFNGVLQFRVWGITSGRWITDWINAV